MIGYLLFSYCQNGIGCFRLFVLCRLTTVVSLLVLHVLPPLLGSWSNANTPQMQTHLLDAIRAMTLLVATGINSKVVSIVHKSVASAQHLQAGSPQDCAKNRSPHVCVQAIYTYKTLELRIHKVLESKSPMKMHDK